MTTTKVWVNPDDSYHKLVAATDSALILADPDEADLDAVVYGIEEGNLGVLEDAAVIIWWDCIFKIRSNRNSALVDVWWRDGQDEFQDIDFASKEQRDQFFRVVEGKLAKLDQSYRLQYTEKELSRFEASLMPLAWVAGISFLTWIFYMACELVIGSTAVFVVGGFCLAIAVLILIDRVADPPIWMTLAPPESDRSGRASS